jgi:hypothetical protein
VDILEAIRRAENARAKRLIKALVTSHGDLRAALRRTSEAEQQSKDLSARVTELHAEATELRKRIADRRDASAAIVSFATRVESSAPFDAPVSGCPTCCPTAPEPGPMCLRHEARRLINEYEEIPF